jgi:hypothetical protein
VNLILKGQEFLKGSLLGWCQFFLKDSLALSQNISLAVFFSGFKGGRSFIINRTSVGNVPIGFFFRGLTQRRCLKERAVDLRKACNFVGQLIAILTDFIISLKTRMGFGQIT